MTPAIAAVPKRVRRRRRRKHEGPPTLQFVTATDPEQFKDRTTMKGVRSQAMIQYRYKLDQSKETGTPSSFQETFLSETSTSSDSHTTSPIQVPPHAPVSQLPLTFNLANFRSQDHSPDENSSQDIFRSLLNDSYFMTLSGYRRALIAVQLDYARIKPVTDHEATDEKELTFALGVVEKVLPYSSSSAITFDGTDPFRALPQFASSGISSIALIRQSNRHFVSSSTIDIWVPIVMTHPHALLSTCCLTSTYMDMMSGLTTDSERSTLIKNESIIWINSELSNQETQTTDMTIIMILHLLAGELRNCDENVFKIHESGIERIVMQRGGMSKLSWNGVVAELVASVIYDIYIFTERQPAPTFQNFIPNRSNPLKTSTAIPESPLYCPRAEFFTLAASNLCTEQIYNILSDMRDLTEVFLKHHNSTSNCGNLNSLPDPLFDPIFSPSSDPSPPAPIHTITYQTKLNDFQNRLSQYPSAHTQNHAHTHNWLYESIRLASVIYTTALIHRIPLSAASTFPDFAPRSARCPSLASDTHPPHSTNLATTLYETFKRTDMSSCWGSLSGIFYCVSLIGAAAARTPSVPSTFSPVHGLTQKQSTGLSMGFGALIDPVPRLGGFGSHHSFASVAPTPEQERRAWARRCMVMYATRVRTVLVFGHPVATIAAQKRLLAVMEVLGRVGGSDT